MKKNGQVKSIVAGGAGFIGSHLAHYLAGKNHEVHVIDNYRTGNRINLNGHNEILIHNFSITDKEHVFEVCEGADYIFNFAALVSIPESILNPYECININVMGFLNLLEAAKRFKTKKIVQSSSAAVYGESKISPLDTDIKPEPRNPYGISKLDDELFAKMYNDEHGVKTVSLRYFNVYGPKQSVNGAYAAAVPIFIKKAIYNETITIFGDGNQTRDFVYIDDVITANYIAAVNDVTGVFNIAGGKAISILDLAKMIINLSDSKSKIEFKPTREGDVKHSLACIDDSRKLLGFNPIVSMEEGLSSTIRYYKENKIYA